MTKTTCDICEAIAVGSIHLVPNTGSYACREVRKATNEPYDLCAKHWGELINPLAEALNFRT